MYMIAEAWNETLETTLKKSWHKIWSDEVKDDITPDYYNDETSSVV